MSDKDMDRLPQRSALGEKPAVKPKTAIRTLVSGVVADLRRLVGRLRSRT
jgi:hypothetical protein